MARGCGGSGRPEHNLGGARVEGGFQEEREAAPVPPLPVFVPLWWRVCQLKINFESCSHLANSSGTSVHGQGCVRVRAGRRGPGSAELRPLHSSKAGGLSLRFLIFIILHGTELNVRDSGGSCSHSLPVPRANPHGENSRAAPPTPGHMGLLSFMPPSEARAAPVTWCLCTSLPSPAPRRRPPLLLRATNPGGLETAPA